MYSILYTIDLLFTDGDAKMSVSDNCALRYPFICEAATDDSVIDYHHPPGTECQHNCIFLLQYNRLN